MKVITMIRSKHRWVHRRRRQVAHSISRYQSQFRPVFEEYIASRLLRVNSNSVVRDDGTRCRWYLEFFGGELEYGREGRGFRNAKHFEGKLRIRSQRHLKCHFRHGPFFRLSVFLTQTILFDKSLNK